MHFEVTSLLRITYRKACCNWQALCSWRAGSLIDDPALRVLGNVPRSPVRDASRRNKGSQGLLSCWGPNTYSWLSQSTLILADVHIGVLSQIPFKLGELLRLKSWGPMCNSLPRLQQELCPRAVTYGCAAVIRRQPNSLGTYIPLGWPGKTYRY